MAVPLALVSPSIDTSGPPRRIVCAAIRDLTGTIVLGPRHFDQTMHAQIANLNGYTLPWEQGFIDQRGVFLSREAAFNIALAANQIVRRVGGDEYTLYSENLY